MRGSQGGIHPRRIFRFQPADFFGGFSFAFCDPKNPPQNPPLRGEFLFQKSPGLEAPETHRPPPPRESKSKSCAFGSGTVTFPGGSFQEKTPGLIGPRNLRILIGRIAVAWPCMECHVPCYISIYWVWDSVKQSEGWGRNTALIAKSPTRHSNFFIENVHHKSSLLVWLPKIFDTEYDRANVPPYNGNDPPPAPGSLKRSLFPTLLNEVQNKGTQGVRARYGAELPPIISIVRCPGRPVISVPEIFERENGPLGTKIGETPSSRSKNGPLRRGNGPLRLWCWLAFQLAA